jgi:hypothetical protein
VVANIESATLTPDQPLEEYSLDGRILTITLVNEEFVNPGSIDETNFYLVNAPTGVGIESASASTTVATITLEFDGTDFDIPYPGFAVGMYPTGLRYTSDVDLITAPAPISAYVENPQATLVPGPQLTEYTLNGRVLTITLSEENFIDPAGLVPGNFTLLDAPPGLTVQSVVSANATSASLELAFNFTDFDIDYPDFHIMIDAMELVQSASNLLTDTLSILYGLEPVITGIAIPDVTMNIGSDVVVTITVENDEGNVFSLVEGGVIGGNPLVGLTRVNETTYTSNFTVVDGGLDYPASQDIHVIGVQLMNGAIAGNTFTGYIVQDNDPIDANRPEIQYIYTYIGGGQNVGDEILVIIQAFENGLTFTPASHVNNVLLTDSRISLEPEGAGRYNIFYTIAEGDNHVTPGELPVAITAIDPAGNEGVETPIDANTISIDASTPVISRAYVSFSTDEDIGVGERIDITVVADQPGYRNLAGSWINNVPVGPQVTFSDNGDGTYLYSYTVGAADGTVERGNLAINILLQDAAPFTNTSAAFTDLDDNNIQIQTARPSATISGSAQICPGESTDITIVLGGIAPWTLDISDGSSTYQRTSSTSNYSESVSPEVTTVYTVVRVVDGTGNDNVGAGQAVISVPDIPTIQIINLQPRYDVKTQPVELDYTPQGGTFTGPGITASPWTFSPEAAGESPVNSPHEITYTYTHFPSGCKKSVTREVVVVSESGFIQFEREGACFDDATFQITGVNEAGTTGSFAVLGTIPSGAFTDGGNNTAVLRPVLLGLQDDADLVIEYTFEDQSGFDLTIHDTLSIEYLEEARIDFIPDVEICQNETPFVLGGNYADNYLFRSSGSGVVNQGSGNYYFDPGRADTGSNWVVYEYLSPWQCSSSDSVELTVLDAPNAGFTVEAPCVPLAGGGVLFSNRSDADTTVTWRWNFGDPESGSNNLSDLPDPIHHYGDTGSYTVSLEVTTDQYCSDQVVKTIDLHPAPEAGFSWNSNCLTYDPVVIMGQENVFPPDAVVEWSWKIESNGTEILSDDTTGRQLSFAFPTVGTFDIHYGIRTGLGCVDSNERTITLNPTHYLTPDRPYAADFEGEGHGWLAEDGSETSWTLDVDLAEFPIDAASGVQAWYTDVPDENNAEQSWVISPCFSFHNFHRPMVSLDIKRSLHRDRDGAALQYTVDNGITWHNVGDVDDGGLNWYNSKNIIPSVGGLNTGWTGELVAAEDEQWIRAAHELDTLTDEQEVRFRIAFGSLDDAREETNDGFAFDNFTLKQRTRLTVLEYFTNANTPACYPSDTTVLNLMKELPVDVVMLQYHAQGSQPDKFFSENPVPANNRGTIYGVTGIPYAVLDGGIMSYDFSTSLNTPNVEDIRQRSLVEPDFDLSITLSRYAPLLEFSIEIRALKDLERRERTLYAVVLQKKVDDPAYVGTNGITEFWQVARKMLPDAGGTYLGSKSWSADETEYANLTYESSFFPTDSSDISVVVFMQDEQTGEILQASTSFQYTVSAPDESVALTQILLYPNPARELVNVWFEEPPAEKMRFILYDLSGKRVIQDAIDPFQQHFTRSLEEVAWGMYIVEIRSWSNRRIFYREKLLHY